jgi:hypothetical protein
VLLLSLVHRRSSTPSPVLLHEPDAFPRTIAFSPMSDGRGVERGSRKCDRAVDLIRVIGNVAIQ